jgi:hypothetical protein
MNIEKATIVEILPTKIWIENDLFGGRHVMMQHQGCHEFQYCSFGYDYAYTSNAGTHSAAIEMAKALGATEPIEQKTRDLKMLTKEQLINEISACQKLLKEFE